MNWFCPSCGCEMDATSEPDGKGGTTFTVNGCHCGAHGVQSFAPPKPVKTDKCPHAPDGPELTGAFTPATRH